MTKSSLETRAYDLEAGTSQYPNNDSQYDDGESSTQNSPVDTQGYDAEISQGADDDTQLIVPSSQTQLLHNDQQTQDLASTHFESATLTIGRQYTIDNSRAMARAVNATKPYRQRIAGATDAEYVFSSHKFAS